MFPDTPFPNPADPAANANDSHVIDVTMENFQQEVLEKSLTTPVLVDFWAEWCGPCKQLGPILEKLAGEYNGAFILAKVDVDAQQQLAAQFGIRSIPTVMLLKDGQLADGFPGVIPEGQVRQFLAQHEIVPAEAAEPAEAPPESPAEAIARLRQTLAATPDDDSVKLDLALALARNGEADEAKTLIAALPANLGTDDRALSANVLINNAAHLQGAPEQPELERRLAENPSDIGVRHLLGLRLLSDGENEAALQHFLEMLKLDRDFQDGLPRRVLIEAFNVIPDPALVSQYRRKMASLLF